MIKKNQYRLLIPYYCSYSNGESEDAEALFKKFATGDFCYDDISNHPGYLSYSSAELLLDLIPLIIDEMLQRKDIDNYLVYPIIDNIDLNSDHSHEIYLERTKRLIALADKKFADKVCQFLTAMIPNPPNDDEQVQRLLSFWKKKLEELKTS